MVRQSERDRRCAWHCNGVSAEQTTVPREMDLYPPVKALLESQGYVVKGEVQACDVVGVRGEEPPVVVELKRTFNLALVLQGVDRLAMTDHVYLAVGRQPDRLSDVLQLCRRLGLGLMVVSPPRARVLVDPLPYRPRHARVRASRLLREHQLRVGDPSMGGSVRRPIMTAYRQEALRCAAALEAGPRSLRSLLAVADGPRAGRILRDDVFGWFERVERGVYQLSPRGRRILDEQRARETEAEGD